MNNPYLSQYPQPQYPQYPAYPQNVPVYPTVQRKVDFTQGRASAEVYPVEAGQEVFLLDVDNPNIYRKARGFDNKLQPMEVYDLVIHQEVSDKPQIDLSAYMTSEQVEQAIKNEVDRRLSELSFKPTTKRNSKKEDDDE